VPSEAGKKKSREGLSESLKLTIDTLNPGLEKVEKLAKAVVMREEWTVDNGLLTPTFKTKRNQIEKIHTPMYGDWFNDDSDVIYEEDNK
jgi:long-chain acyl-CoA synthetase